MALYWMQLVRIAAVSDVEHRDGFPDLQQKTYRPLEGAAPRLLDAGDLEGAKNEAAQFWQIHPNTDRSEGYWILEAEKGCQFVYDHAESVERLLAHARSF
jgi:hypothetical protein